MSTLTKAVKQKEAEIRIQEQGKKINRVTNFMDGVSYGLNPIDTLRIVTASSIFAEPAYYRAGGIGDKVVDGTCSNTTKGHAGNFDRYDIFNKKFVGMKTSDVMINVIRDALSYDFGATLEWAVKLRNEYFMRLNPQVIMVEAATHPDRAKFTEKNPGVFDSVNQQVMHRADEPASQLSYFLFYNGEDGKKHCPNILKKSWAKKLSGLGRYAVAKYKNAEIGMINTVRICHAKSAILDELMKTGTVEVKEDEKTWENLRSAGKGWKEILETIELGHMALLRNLRNIFDPEQKITLDESGVILGMLKNGVKDGKQWPYRYWSAYSAIKDSKINYKQNVLDALEECIDLSMENLPKLKGKTICLTDNSGSAWGTLTSEYGSTKVAIIDNLSSVITAKNAQDGYVGVFGDRLEIVPVSKRDGVLGQLEKINRVGGGVGGGTENGIWLFLDRAIKNKEHWDNIFIYSDMQAGHGGLYGTYPYGYHGYTWGVSEYIDVFKLVSEYRKINPKVNVFSVQTAGYTNVLLPEYGYRANVLTGWTGKELAFAEEMIKFWDEKDAQKATQGGAQ